VFFSIKGIYYQADVMGETVTWIVPHKYGHQVRVIVDGIDNVYIAYILSIECSRPLAGVLACCQKVSNPEIKLVSPVQKGYHL
jgi:hypothetical protein